MATDVKESLVKDLVQTLTDDFDKSLIQAYAERFDYGDLERTFREQLTKEVSRDDEN